MTENTLAVTKSQATALAEVIRSEGERLTLLVWLDKVTASPDWAVPTTAHCVYDLGVLPGQEYVDVDWDEG